MSVLRAFIAIELPAELQQKIHKATANFRRGIDSLVRWTAAENMHLTLKFLGDVSQPNMAFLIQMLRTQADLVNPFAIQLAGLGTFPSPKRPRVIYIGIQAPAALGALHREIEL